MATAKPDGLRRNLIAKVHIARKQMELDDDTYRALLTRITGKASCSDIPNTGLHQVLAECQRLGWQATNQTSKGRRPNPTASREALMGKLEAQLAEAGKGWPYADGMAKHMYKVDKCDWLDAKQLQGLIAAMYKDAQRHERKVR